MVGSTSSKQPNSSREAKSAAGVKPLVAPPPSNGSLLVSSLPPGVLPVGNVAALPGARPLAAHALRRYPPAPTTIVAPLTPAWLRTKKLRSGKWVPEEEAYADALIQIFDKGLLKECDNGITLRSFLSQKLHCAPMRISKKYAGKGIGKMVYLSKLGCSSGSSSQRIGPYGTAALVGGSLEPVSKQEIEAMEKLVKEAEDKCFRAVFPGGEYEKMKSQAGVAAVPRALNSPAAKPVTAKRGTKSVASRPAVPATRASAVPPAAMDPSMKLLHQSYMHALKQQQGVTMASALNQQRGVHPGAHPMPTNFLAAAASHSARPVNHLPHPGTNNAYRKTTAGVGLHVNGSHAMHPTIAHAVGAPKPGGEAPGVAAPTEMPDFLSGFDKVALNLSPSKANGTAPLQPTSAPLPDGHVHHSPTFTSRSFDDLHRFLGKDLTPLNGPVEHTKLPSALPSGTTTTGAATEPDALFSAESYALFAQESALAASQHSAYMPHNPIMIQGEVASSAAYDVDGLMRLVSGTTEALAADPLLQTGSPEQQQSQGQEQRGVTTAPTTRAQLYRYDSYNDTNVVSGSDPSSATESESMRGGLTSESTSNGSDNSESGDNASDSASDDAPLRKRARLAADGEDDRLIHEQQESIVEPKS